MNDFEPIFNYDLPEHIPPPELTPPDQPRNPLAALLLSMLYPGLGHLYVGLRKQAGWIIVCEFFALMIANQGRGTLHAAALLSVPTLYCFAIIDAYFSAREWNAGATPLMHGKNPRIAAVLNLLTKGFGYFYLGHRTKGILCFLAVSGLQIALQLRNNVWTSILAVTLQIVIAADGYRIARECLLSTYSELEMANDGGPGLIDLANPIGLQPRIASALFFALAAIALTGYGALRALNGHSVTSIGTLEAGPLGLLYRNSDEHIKFTVPQNWDYRRPADTLVEFAGEGCSVIVIEQFAIYAVDSTIEANEKDVQRRHPSAEISYPRVILASHPSQSFEAAFNNQAGLFIHQRFIAHRRGLKIILLIETWVDQKQRERLDAIEASMQE